MNCNTNRYDALRDCSTLELEELLSLSFSDYTLSDEDVWTILTLLEDRKADDRAADIDAEQAWDALQAKLAAPALPGEREDNSPRPARRRRRWALAAAIAAAVVLCTSTALAMDGSSIPTWIAQLLEHSAANDRNWADISPDARIELNETQNCEEQNLSMTVQELVLEEHHLLVQTTFSHLTGEEQVMSTSELPWDVVLSQGGETVLAVGSDSLSTTTLDGESEDLSILYTIELGELEGETLVGRETTLSFVYGQDGTATPEAGYFAFTFTPTECVEEQHWDIGREYAISGGTVYVDSVDADAIHLTLNAELRCPTEEGESLNIAIQTGNEEEPYEADRVREAEDGNAYVFPRFQSLGSSLTFTVTLVKNEPVDENGALLPEAYEELGTFTVETAE